MKKITQNLTNVKAWQSTIFAFMFLFSLTINAQEVGDEFLANPGVNTTAVDAETGYDAAGTFNNNGNGNYGGWTAGTGGAYASATTANGDCHSPDRMFRLFKTGGTDGQFINQIVTALPAGNLALSASSMPQASQAPHVPQSNELVFNDTVYVPKV